VRGAKTEHTFECEDLGRLERLRIWHDNKGFGAGWHLSYIIVAAGDVYSFSSLLF
jgi:hypothetical protein